MYQCLLDFSNDESKREADTLYEELMKCGAEVLYDDREGVRSGQMFADADLIGVPIRVIVSPRNLKDNKIEVTKRDNSVHAVVSVSESLAYIMKLRERLYLDIDG
ncbi:MAG: hypothetical protein K2N73_18335 [Lachnospiraceae bacterium]|nr:hypothetical protein [Lachnospiraceae bacterium]